MADYLTLLMETPWAPPAGLTADALKPVETTQRLWLSDVIALMTSVPRVDPQEDEAFQNKAFEDPDLARALAIDARAANAAQRYRASKALFAAAFTAGRSIMSGMRDRAGMAYEPILLEYFAIPRGPGSEDNSISFDMNVSGDRWDQEANANLDQWVKHGHIPTWFGVLVDGAWIIGWLKSQIGAASHSSEAPSSGKPPCAKRLDHRSRPRGPKTGKRERVATEILQQISRGEVTIDSLNQTSQKVLAAKYGVKSRDTVTKAIQRALSQLSTESNSDK